ncbi:MAG: manganese efflux pump MntP [Streptosporangiaceae bacterium]
MAAALILVAVSLGLSNLAASIGIGVGGVDRRTRLRVGIIFGLFEAAMPVVGLVIGHGLASSLGRAADWVAAALLILAGGAGVAGEVRARVPARQPADPSSSGGHPGIAQLLVSGFALSLDNLAAGFALGSYQVGVLAGVVTFGVVSAGMSLAGLEFGARIGARAGAAGRIIGGLVLVGVGIAIGLGALG